jgi:hypothetical protein
LYFSRDNDLSLINRFRLVLNELIHHQSSTVTTDANHKDLKVLIGFMCGGDSNDVELFFNQLASRFTLTVTNQSGETSFILDTFLGRHNRKVSHSVTMCH